MSLSDVVTTREFQAKQRVERYTLILDALRKAGPKGLSQKEISFATGIPQTSVMFLVATLHTQRSVSRRWRKVTLAEFEPGDERAFNRRANPTLLEKDNPTSRDLPKRRRCLRCREMFMSEHAGNRLCEGCNIAIASHISDEA